MAFYGYKRDVGECHWTPYNPSSDYEFSLFTHESPYEFKESKSDSYCNSYSYSDCYDSPAQVNQNHSVCMNSYVNLIPYEPIEYFDSSLSPFSNYYNGFESRSGANYSVYNYNEPKIVQYEPPTYARVYLSTVTKPEISDSTLEFDLIEFDEYDPTPYSGGYDQSETYGRPLPPSDDICYPHSSPPLSEGDGGASLEGFSFASIPSPYGENGKQSDIKTDPQPRGENGDKTAKNGDSTDAEARPHVENGDKISSDSGGSEISSDSGGSEIGELDVKRGDELPSYDHVNGFEDRQIPQIPYGSGLECMDLCESLFGYWPCLAKRYQKGDHYCPVCDHGRRNPWDSAADYLFGTPLSYDERNYGGYQASVYNYGQYYNVQQPQYENSWLH